MKLSLILLLLAPLQVCYGAKILFLIPIPSKSHYILGERLMDEMVKKGHEVTSITAFKRPKPDQNIAEIVIPHLKELFLNNSLMMKNSTEGKFSMRKMSVLSFLFFGESLNIITNEIMKHKQVQELLRPNQKFDLVVGECFMLDALMAGFSQRFNAPLVALATSMPNIWSNEMVGNPAPASYIPDMFLGFTEKMTFLERLMNFLSTSMQQLLHYTVYLPSQDTLMREFFGNDLPHIKEIISNTSLVLVNHHYSLAFPRPYLPNMIEIGNFHVRPPKPLPQDLKKFMDDAKEGVIFFSMGSNLESSEFPKEKFDAILKALSKLKQRVLWKFEAETPQNLPKNVKISKWFPQSDILAHPKVKLFITHGGLLSLTESISRGVPVVGVPIFGDQPTNVKIVQRLELGVKLEYDDITESSLYNAIQEVITNPKYTTNVKEKSKILNDVPLPAIDTAAYWLEYVMRHKGAPHLRSAAQDLAWYQLYLLDVLAVIGVTLFLFFYFLYRVIGCACRIFCGCKNQSVPSQKKKN